MGTRKWWAIRKRGRLGWQVFRSTSSHREALNDVYEYQGPFESFEKMLDALPKQGGKL